MQGANVTTSSRRRISYAGAQEVAVSAHRVGTAVLRLLVITAIAVSAASLMAHSEPPAPDAWASVSVDSHTTLWDLAIAHPVEGLGTAGTVDLILAENGLTSSTLSVGQTLHVPASAPVGSALAQR